MFLNNFITKYTCNDEKCNVQVEKLKVHCQSMELSQVLNNYFKEILMKKKKKGIEERRENHLKKLCDLVIT